ncbi:putative phosphatidylserine decarboxylase [Aspergillus steynii IBT 23096]|uniref:Putative phosphatidylserine decarboxylase n=1 Tax=Aspergillus steynii IBT 23096 TaxID=1392250 RepID=A0A2I2G6C0_9EURO|nr:putative phosphatidylserine decarboxylase [Aspergillus steynii IBT 23096]PLB48424.1 putative phosphatidylserine decarboxylase [Aspergillus steynii IBT 23096]
MTTSQYEPRTAIVRDLRKLIFAVPGRVSAFRNAIKSARLKDGGGQDDMNRELIYDLDGYLRFCDDLLEWAPDVSSPGDELLRKLLVFYWVMDQPTTRGLQTPILPSTAGAELTPLSSWLVNYAREIGHWMDTKESADHTDSFYNNPLYNQEAYLWEDPPEGGWKSFNQFFARRWKDINVARPLDGDGDDTIIVHGADSKFGGSWDITGGFVTLDPSPIVAKGIEWPIDELLQWIGKDFNDGSLMHAFLSPHDYHRQHAPVSGKVVEVKNIQDQVFLQVTKGKDGKKLAPDRGLVRHPEEASRRHAKKNKQLEQLDAPDDAGYQWCQTRGLIIIETDNHGKVAVLPIGMAQVSSVVMKVEKNQCVKKGDEISYFQWGGSDIVIVFQEKVKYRSDLEVNETKINVRSQLATFQ